jgi:hypothetical protein
MAGVKLTHYQGPVVNIKAEWTLLKLSI